MGTERDESLGTKLMVLAAVMLACALAVGLVAVGRVLIEGVFA